MIASARAAKTELPSKGGGFGVTRFASDCSPEESTQAKKSRKVNSIQTWAQLAQRRPIISACNSVRNQPISATIPTLKVSDPRHLVGGEPGDRRYPPIAPTELMFEKLDRLITLRIPDNRPPKLEGNING
jgi:hypothetical protein